MDQSKNIKRRNFLKYSGSLVGMALAAPSVIPSSALGLDKSVAPSERITMAFIGMGTMGNGHLFGEAWTYLPEGYIGRKDVQTLAVCDVWENKREVSRYRANKFYAKRYQKGEYQSVTAYKDFREVLARKDIDAVLIATPIHWHATMAILAAKAGKDIYCEKPTSVCIAESQAMVKAVTENKCIFQAGTQQRSEYDARFRVACEYMRNQRIGDLKEIYTFRDGGGAIWPTTHEAEQPIPKELDWDLWLGPAPDMPYQGRSDAHLFGFGGINWGQHHYDIVQWCLDADKTGPVEISIENGSAVYVYANGVKVYGRPYQDDKIGETGGGWYFGSEGCIGVDREHLLSKPPSILEKPLGANNIQVYHSDSHSGNFLECIKTRKQTICNVNVAHHSASVMLLGGIAKQLNRKLKWDPIKECFINDDEANKMLSLTKRDPWIV